MKGKINGIKHLAVLLHKVTQRKNRFKNKDLRSALKVLGEMCEGHARDTCGK